MQVETRAFTLSFREGFSFGARTLAARQSLLVRVGAGDAFGFGECAPLPGFLDAPCAEIEDALHMLAASVQSALPADHEVASPHAIQQAATASAGSPSSAAATASAGSPSSAAATASAGSPTSAAFRLAAAGLDTACADLAARRAGISLAEWLVPSSPDEVAENRLLRLDDLPLALREAEGLEAAGIRAAKVKLLAGRWRTQVRLLREVHRAFPSLRFRLDANAQGAPDEAHALLSSLALLPIEYVEEPLRPDFGVHDFLALAARSPIPIAADERLLDPTQRAALLAADWNGVLVLKPMFLGGPRPALELLRQAAACGLRVTVTTALEGAVGRAMAGAVACAAEGLGVGSGAHGLATGSLLAEDLPVLPPLCTGTRPPGLGFDVEWS